MTFSGLAKEPLLHFVLLAAGLFGLDYLTAQTQKTRIVIDEQTARYLIQQREDLELRMLSPDERRDTVDAYVEDEILYNEAYKRSLDRGDSRMRRNLILKMRGLLTGDLEEPTDETLRNYYQENQQTFTRPPMYSLEQVFFSDASAVPEGLLDVLNEGADPVSFGESSFNMPRQMIGLTQQALVGTLGVDGARVVLAIKDDRWHGPVESSQGIHYVRLTERLPASVPSYEKILPYLEGDWLMAESRKRIAAEVASLRDEYEVIIDMEFE